MGKLSVRVGASFMKFFGNRVHRRREGGRTLAIMAGEAARSNASPSHPSLETHSVVSENVTAPSDTDGQTDSFSSIFSGPDLASWWAADYSVRALKERGQFDFWENARAPVFSFDGEEWTPYHMPLASRTGEPSPKLLLALSEGTLRLIQRELGISTRSIQQLKERWSQDSNAEALEYFNAEKAGEIFAEGLKAVIENCGNQIRLNGLIAPAHLSIAGVSKERKDGEPRTLIFNNCIFFGELRIDSADLDMLRFIHCMFADRQRYSNLNVGLLWWLNCAYHKSVPTHRTRQFVSINDSEIIEINSNNFAPDWLRIDSTNVRNGIYFYELRGREFRCYISNGEIGNFTYRSHSENRECAPELSANGAKLYGTIYIDANMNHASFHLEDTTVAGPFTPYGARLHPRSVFSNVSYKIDPNLYSKMGEESRAAREEVFNAVFEDDRHVTPDWDAIKTRYVSNVENGFRHMRKLAEDNKQTDYELQFYARQFEARGLRQDIPLPERALMKVYEVTSQYGTSLFRPVFWFGTFSVICGLLGAGAAAAMLAGADDIVDAAIWSGSQVLPEMPPPITSLELPAAFEEITGNWMGTLYAMIVGAKVVSLALIALFLIALRRRFQID